LIVDEVLAVGDAEFQKKCLGKMGDEAKGGRTVLFVSHNMGAMRGLCKRAIWLEQGRLKRQGESRSLIDEYLADAAISNQPIVNFAGRKNGGDESHKLIIHTLEWLTEVPPRHGEPVAFRIHYESKTDLSEVAFGLGFSGIDGTRLLTLDSDGSGIRPSLVSGQRGCVEFHVDELPVAPGLYSLDLGARSGDRCALVYFGGFAQTEILAGPSTPDTYVCFPGSGVRKASLCRWTLDTVTSGTH
jgi:lipopolysaccharide transport system ATP-binding protein